MIEAVEGTEDPEVVEVYDDNWPQLALFLELRGSWVLHNFPDGSYKILGLDWSKVASYLTMLKLDNTEQIVPDLRVMQDAALSAWYAMEDIDE